VIGGGSRVERGLEEDLKWVKVWVNVGRKLTVEAWFNGIVSWW